MLCRARPDRNCDSSGRKETADVDGLVRAAWKGQKAEGQNAGPGGGKSGRLEGDGQNSSQFTVHLLSKVKVSAVLLVS